MRFDGIYGNGTSITKSSSWKLDAFYEHYWAPTWSDLALRLLQSCRLWIRWRRAVACWRPMPARLSTGATNATGSFEFAVLMLVRERRGSR